MFQVTHRGPFATADSGCSIAGNLLTCLAPVRSYTLPCVGVAVYILALLLHNELLGTLLYVTTYGMLLFKGLCAGEVRKNCLIFAALSLSFGHYWAFCLIVWSATLLPTISFMLANGVSYRFFHHRAQKRTVPAALGTLLTAIRPRYLLQVAQLLVFPVCLTSYFVSSESIFIYTNPALCLLYVFLAVSIDFAYKSLLYPMYNFLTDLALRKGFSSISRREHALYVLRRIVEKRRRLAHGSHMQHKRALNMSLNNFSLLLRDNNNTHESLSIIQEATLLGRQLVAKDASQYKPLLAMNLLNLSNSFHDIRHEIGALKSISESVAIYRELYKSHPEKFISDFALALNNQAVRLRECGDHKEALQAAHESAALLRTLFKTESLRSLPILAQSLINLSNSLNDVGNAHMSKIVLNEAIICYRRLVYKNPDCYNPKLALGLSNLAIRLNESGDQAGALLAIQEAADIRRELALRDPANHQLELAECLYKLANHLRFSGAIFDAARVEQEAKLLWSNHADFRPLAVSKN